MNPVLYEFGNIEIRWYSVLILIGIVLGFTLAIIEGKRKNIDKDIIFDMGFYIVLFGIIGARLYYCLFNYSIYKDNLLEMLKIWNGGLAIHGGIIAGLLTIIIYSKKKKIPTLQLTDIVAPSLILAQAIGRWGNFFNSEAHGPATSMAFLKSLKIIPNFVIKGMNIEGIYYHPTFYYESLWCIAGFILLIIIRKLIKNLKNGELTCIYLIWYSIGRFFIETLRTDSLMINKFKVAQLISIGIIIISIIIFIIIKIHNPKEEIKEEDKIEKQDKPKEKKNKKKDKKKTKKEEPKEDNKKEIKKDEDKKEEKPKKKKKEESKEIESKEKKEETKDTKSKKK